MTATAAKRNGRKPKTTEVVVEVRTVDPGEASELLAKNTHNRKQRDRRVEELAGAMLRGEWKFNGDAIRVGQSGTLLDGQHRLAAIVRSGKSQQFVVITGLPDSVQETMDSGAKRSAADALKLRGEKDVFRLAACARLVRAYEDRETFRNPFVQYTAQQVLATVDKHPGIRESVRRADQVRVHTQIPHSVASACHYLFSLVDPVDTEVFYTRLVQGTDLSPVDPIHALRRQFTMHRPKGTRISSLVIGALVIKSFNYWRAGAEVKHLVYRPGGATAEKFPTVDGLTVGPEGLL